ncbi:MAG TPA: ATP-NAD kinase family protein [Sulfolobales archaeon]|nr:ATP-NAD kinase family protein [Sulfolobales archaeon]
MEIYIDREPDHVKLERSRSKLRLCFLLNPVAGLGGPLGLKGSDSIDPGDAARRLRAGIVLPSISRASRFLSELLSLGFDGSIVSPEGIMGGDLLLSTGYDRVELVKLERPYIDGISTREHTIEFVRNAAKLGCEVLVFVGGDGTARDVYHAMSSGSLFPVLGVPAGVKVYSGVFATGPESAAYLIKLYSEGLARIEYRPVIDADEDMMRQGFLKLARVGELLTLTSDALTQDSKETGYGYSVEGIAAYIREIIDPQRLYLLGPGRTIAEIARILGIKKTMFGVDALYNWRLVGADLDSESIEKLIQIYGNPVIIVTPIGGTGFLLGRGNQQITPEIIRRAGKNNIVIVMSPEKASRMNTLLIDTGDKRLDEDLEGYYRAIVGYKEEKIVKIKASWKTG